MRDWNVLIRWKFIQEQAIIQLNMKRSFFKIACILALTGLVSGCGGGSKGRPPRKQLPTLTDDAAWEGDYGSRLQQEGGSGGSGAPGKFYFSAVDTVIAGQPFISLSMPDPAGDSLAWVMVKSYEPFASGAFLLMQQQGKKGAIINFRQSGEGMGRTSYSAKDILGNSLSVIFLWDRQSAMRASGFMNELQKLPAIQCTVTGE
jgi:hypothetical protein